MTLSDLSIHRPVFAWMLMMALIVFGGICFTRMGVSQLPDVDIPIINITARYPGAAPQVMESDVVDPIEDAVMSTQGVKTVTSLSQNGVATITVEFNLDRNVDLALQDIETKISQVQDQLPNQMEPVVLTKTNPDDFPIMWLTVSDPKMATQDLMVFVRDHVRDMLTTIPGVGSLWTPGFLEPNLRVWVNNQKLNQLALTISDVIYTIQNEHLEPPAGRVEHQQTEFNLRTLGEALTPKDFEKILINTRGGGPNFNPTPLGKVARVVEGTEDILQFARSNGRSAIGLGIVKQRGSNAVEVARAVKSRLSDIRKSLPQGMELYVNFDSSRFIEESVDELVLTLGLAALLTSLVCWLFLGSWSSTLNVLLAIPTSVVGTFIVLYFAGFTLNLFTLLGLSLAIGIVVDDAIMVLENIIRHRELKKTRKEAALVGAREITFAALAATVSIIAIFLPIALMRGIIGRFLYQFGVTMSVAVALSLLEALTLTPMRASKFVEVATRKTRIGEAFESLFELIKSTYLRSLHFSLLHRWKVVGLATVFFVLSFSSVRFLNMEFQPPQDQSQIIILLKTPVGSSISLTDLRVKAAEDFLLHRSEVDSLFSAVGGFTGGEVNSAFLFVSMKPKGERGISSGQKKELSQQEFMEVVRTYLVKTIPDADPVVQDPSVAGFTSSRGFPVEFAIQGPDWNALAEQSKVIMDSLAKTGLVTDLNTDFQIGAPEIQIIPDRTKAGQRGVSIAAIGQTISATIAGAVAGRYHKGGHRYDVRVKLEENGVHPIQQIKSLFVRNNRGEVVPLASVINIQQKPTIASLTRRNRQRAITISANVAQGKSQQEAIQAAETISKQVLPEGYNFVLVGSSEEFQDSFQSLVFALIMGLIVAYMVLASQFNSFIDPITVFMALPFSFSGAFLGLWVAGQSLNIYSMIGLVLLMGIVKKNSILLVDFTNQRREEAQIHVKQALLEACPTRLRPILMTSIATIVGAVPAALAFGPGAESRAPMSISVIGGVFVSTFLTLYVVPCVYSFFAHFDKREKAPEREGESKKPKTA